MLNFFDILRDLLQLRYFCFNFNLNLKFFHVDHLLQGLMLMQQLLLVILHCHLLVRMVTLMSLMFCCQLELNW